MTHIQILPHDPPISRDGRPFGKNGSSHMYSLEWFYPSTTAGAIRTVLGKEQSAEGENPFTNEMIGELQKVSIRGPFPMKEGMLYFPAPRDIVLYEDEQTKGEEEKEIYKVKGMVLRPSKLADEEGWDLEYEGIWPVIVTQDIKPTAGPMFWSKEKLEEWLSEDIRETELINIKENGYLKAFEKERRMHVGIDPLTFSSQDQMLYSTTGLVFPAEEEVGIAVDVSVEKSSGMKQSIENLHTLHPFGGGRRLSLFSQSAVQGWRTPKTVAKALDNSLSFRMLLVTPAIFEHGWIPDFLDKESLEGTISVGNETLEVKLRGACIDRWKAISGWDLKEKKAKPIRRMVPAGSVYFFEIKGNRNLRKQDIYQLWLQSVCKDEQMQRDGFGLAVWGKWNK